MARVLSLAAVLSLVLAGHADAKKGCQTRSCELRVADKQCSQTRVVSCIRLGAWRHRQPFGDMLRVARCESSLDPFNEYAGHYGLYQFLSSTWATTPYRFHWIYSARYQSLATGWMWKVGRRGEWACR